jgi:NitT/TauT family transport system permease protein
MTNRSWLTHSRTAAVLLPVVGLILALALWWVATIVFSIDSYLLPNPGEVVSTFLDQPGYLLEHTWISLVETVEGFVLSIAVGVPVALLIVRSVVVERLLYPLLLAVNAIPKIAIAPLLIIWFGFGQ